MVAVSKFDITCSRCGGDISSQVIRPERFACIYCGWRHYADMPLRSRKEGRVLRLHYVGKSPVFAQLPPLAAMMVDGGGGIAEHCLGLRIACPICRRDGVLSVMKGRDRSLVRWRCRVGHEIRLHRVAGEEVLGWS